MTTITMTITIAVPDGDPTNGGDFAADLVAYVLTHYADPAFTIDRTGIAAARAATSHTATETGPRAALVDEIINYESEQRRQRRDLDRARYVEAERTYDQVMINVPCPTCAASVVEPCQRPSGEVYLRPFLHAKRSSAWQQLMITPPAAARAAMPFPTVVTLDEV